MLYFLKFFFPLSKERFRRNREKIINSYFIFLMIWCENFQHYIHELLSPCLYSNRDESKYLVYKCHSQSSLEILLSERHLLMRDLPDLHKRIRLEFLACHLILCYEWTLKFQIWDWRDVKDFKNMYCSCRVLEFHDCLKLKF